MLIMLSRGMVRRETQTGPHISLHRSAVKSTRRGMLIRALSSAPSQQNPSPLCAICQHVCDYFRDYLICGLQSLENTVFKMHELQVVFVFLLLPLQPHLPFLFVFATRTSFSSLHPSFSIVCYLLFPFPWHLYPNSCLRYSQTFMTIIKIKHDQHKKKRKNPQAAFTYLPWPCCWSTVALLLICLHFPM